MKRPPCKQPSELQQPQEINDSSLKKDNTSNMIYMKKFIDFLNYYVPLRNFFCSSQIANLICGKMA